MVILKCSHKIPSRTKRKMIWIILLKYSFSHYLLTSFYIVLGSQDLLKEDGSKTLKMKNRFLKYKFMYHTFENYDF